MDFVALTAKQWRELRQRITDVDYLESWIQVVMAGTGKPREEVEDMTLIQLQDLDAQIVEYNLPSLKKNQDSSSKTTPT